MAKIIRQPTAWWYECSHICPRCGCVYELEVTDDVQTHAEDESNYVFEVISLCPVCDGPVQTRRKTARKIEKNDQLIDWNIAIDGASYPTFNAGLGGRD